MQRDVLALTLDPFLVLQTGEICLDILKTAWSPAWTLLSVCQAVLALMSDPAPDSPLNCDAGRGAKREGEQLVCR